LSGLSLSERAFEGLEATASTAIVTKERTATAAEIVDGKSLHRSKTRRRRTADRTAARMNVARNPVKETRESRSRIAPMIAR